MSIDTDKSEDLCVINDTILGQKPCLITRAKSEFRDDGATVFSSLHAAVSHTRRFLRRAVRERPLPLGAIATDQGATQTRHTIKRHQPSTTT
jgi:hypothetical protein